MFVLNDRVPASSTGIRQLCQKVALRPWDDGTGKWNPGRAGLEPA